MDEMVEGNIGFSRRAKEQEFEDCNRKALKIAIIGPPNAGKSALTNQLVRAKVCAVSKCIDTTRKNMVTSLTEEECQLVVVDSPGLVGATHAKKVIGKEDGNRVLIDPEVAMATAEHVLVIHDATASGKYIQHRLLHLLHRNAHIPSTLVINKIDLVKKRSNLLPLAETLTEGVIDGSPILTKKRIDYGLLGNVQSPRAEMPSTDFRIHQIDSPAKADGEGSDEDWQRRYNSLLHKPTHKCGWNETRRLFLDRTGWPNFKALFFVSSLTGEGVDGLRDYLQQLSRPSEEWRYKRDQITTKDPKRICEEHVRSQLLDMIPADLGYQLRPRISEWQIDDEDEGPLLVCAEVMCERTRHAKLVLKVAARIEQKMSAELPTLFKVPVEFRLDVRLNPKNSGTLYGKSVELDDLEICPNK